MYKLIQLKARTGFGAFASTSYLGEDCGIQNGWLVMKNVCAIFEIPTQTPKGISIETKFMTSSLLTDGEVRFRLDDSDILFTKDVSPTDTVCLGYEGAMEAFQLQKLKIEKVDSLADAGLSVDGV